MGCAPALVLVLVLERALALVLVGKVCRGLLLGWLGRLLLLLQLLTASFNLVVNRVGRHNPYSSK